MTMTGMVSGKSVVVTGTASGIGRETALLFAREGAARIACLDIADAPNEATAAEIRALGVEAIALHVDLGKVADIVAAFATVKERFGRLDASVHVGGYSWRGETLDVTEEQWDTVINANLRGTFFCCQQALAIMYEQGSGAIVNMSADAAFYPAYGFALQAAGKGGIAIMTRTLALEAGERGVRVNVVSPGIVHTEKAGLVRPGSPPLRRTKRQHGPEVAATLPDQTVPGRYMTGNEIAQACLWLSSDRSSAVNGDLTFVNGGGYYALDY
jgi:NAD(P)-dependent dehydrogenase (short-subunit alcohol dehydrogenase family)